MRVDKVVRSHDETLRLILQALDNGLTFEENFAGGGVAGQPATSTGPDTPPVFQPAATGVPAHTHDATDIVSGILDEPRLVGVYRLITELWPDKVKAGMLLYHNPQAGTQTVDIGYDMLVATPFTVGGTLNVNGRLIVV